MSLVKRPSRILIASMLLGVIFFGQVMVFSQEKFRRNPPYPEPLRPLRFPLVETAVLENGLKLITITRLNTRLITLQIIVQAGEIDSPPGLSGLATVTAEMLLKGTQLMRSSDIEEALDTLGIEVNIEVNADYTIFTFSFLDDHLDQALNLIKSFFSEPAFRATELTYVKRDLYYRLLSRKKDLEKVGFNFFLKKLLYPEVANSGLIKGEEIKN
ncbi:MAG: insulinase family protein, partial [Candidatus Aminicenantes bacterium]|nr:insulinase family protein [Candidatus Aminicenantes bacterium]